MLTVSKKIFILFLCLCISTALFSQKASISKSEMIFSAIKGSVGKPDTVHLLSKKDIRNMGAINIRGEHSGFFKLTSQKPKRLLANTPEMIVVAFEPASDFIGVAHASLEMKGLGITLNLTGLSTKGLEGENEAPLAEIVDAMGYKIDVGWNTLANHLRPELQGEELAPSLFQKANRGEDVELIPVARYSPDFPLNFGYYTHSKTGPVHHQSGILNIAGKFPEHQILFPALSTRQTSFEPGDEPFGLYAISPGHTLYSEDIWNILFHPTHAAHAIRVYPVRDKQGSAVENTFMVCMEEAANGDYNDYVFILKNVKPVLLQKKFIPLFNGTDLTGWYTWLESKGKNNDPENIFTVLEDSTIHDIGKELGYIMTEKSFQNFHLTLEFKWGQEKWPPRDNLKRDSGICYNIPEDEPDQIWPKSVECQIQEGDVGDFWLLGYSTIQVDGKQNPPLKHSQIIKSKDAEKPNGEWNTVEVISFNGKCVHIVNGVVVNYGENSSLIGGKILLQSEYAELFYRNINLMEL